MLRAIMRERYKIKTASIFIDAQIQNIKQKYRDSEIISTI